MKEYLIGLIKSIFDAPMSYMTIKFFVLVAGALLLYYILPKKFRWTVLLLGSGYFYYDISGSRKQMLVFALGIALSYVFGILLDRSVNRKGQEQGAKEQAGEKKKAGSIKQKLLLTAGILISASPLLLSKCSEFLTGSILHTKNINWIIPLGLSFYSLQIIAYLTDIYRGKIRAQLNPLKYGLFVSFFPIIVQGPISRYDQLADQLFTGHSFDQKNIIRGVQLVIWGIFLKLMIADKAAVVAGTLFDGHENFSGFYIPVAALMYALELYADFMSCVTISQGVSEMFGIRLMDNFQRPFFSTSVKQFWGRWHISLSHWLRDYVYIPLGGSRKGRIRKYLNLLITFGVSGLWHGGSWKFLFWGSAQAGFQIVGDVIHKPKNRFLEKVALPETSRLRRFLAMVVTYSIFAFGLIFFRADSFGTGLAMVKSAFARFNPWILVDGSLYQLGLSQKELWVLTTSTLLLILVSFLQERGIRIRDKINSQNLVIRWSIYFIAIWSVWILGTYGFGFDAKDFIYGGF